MAFRFKLIHLLLFAAVAGVLIGIVVSRLHAHRSIVSFENVLRQGIEDSKDEYARLFPLKQTTIGGFAVSIIGPNSELINEGKLKSPFQFEVGNQFGEVYLLVSEPESVFSGQLSVDLMYSVDEAHCCELAHFLDFVIERNLGFKPDHLPVN